ncbi:hypothetical protein Acr_01g0015170 [Actinidia rufa]|uniref:Uncharacterized protein n=1 Tax=Actinidia rufa TaxID=165716 RepID=A0A7J0E6Z0_9ERIC|nr:hypothetical protein Acr_01g0015170 [Actinidia rufa]
MTLAATARSSCSELLVDEFPTGGGGAERWWKGKLGAANGWQ